MSMKKVLIVEDEKDVRTTIVDLLENIGYTTISAKDGIEAIKFTEQDVPDLVISDIMMPNADGYQFSNISKNCRVPPLYHLYF